MFKSPRRNGRSKGYKIKHIIQVTMLLGVSIWLLYQIHNSGDKKPSVAAKISQKSSNDSFKMARKVLRPKVKETKANDEQNNGNEDSEGVVEDHESDEHEEVVESEHVDGKEDSEEMKEDDDKNREQTGKIHSEEIKGKMNGKKKMSPNLKAVEMSIPSGDVNDQSVRGEVANDKMMKNDSSKQPSVDHNERDSKKQSAQQIESAPDSYSSETKAANYMKSTGNDTNMEAGSEQKNDGSILEEEKDTLTDLETLPESGTGGSATLENAATE